MVIAGAAGQDACKFYNPGDRYGRLGTDADQAGGRLGSAVFLYRLPGESRCYPGGQILLQIFSLFGKGLIEKNFQTPSIYAYLMYCPVDD